LYGYSRQGVLNLTTDVKILPQLPGGNAYSTNFIKGDRFFELTNHLGNVLVTISDKKIGVSSNGTTIDYYTADVITANDYAPFGMGLSGRNYNAPNAKNHTYGFNGKMNDNEVKGEGNQIDYGARIYDPRLGRFLSVDPLQKKFPELTPYQFASNSPIANVDLDGKEARYYTSTIVFENHFRCGSRDWEMESQSKGLAIDNQMTGFFTPNGHLGSGTLYTVATVVKNVYHAANGDIEKVEYESKPIIIKQIYKLSESDEMKLDVSKRPMFKGKYQLIVYGRGSDNSESPGEKMNPNSITESIDMKAFDEFMEPILLGINPKSPIDYTPPTLEDIVNKQVDEVIRKAENASQAKVNTPDPTITYCETCQNKVKKDINGKMTFDTSGVQNKVPGDTSTNHGTEPDRKTKKNGEN
jgi:RHS repeat-associated protein